MECRKKVTETDFDDPPRLWDHIAAYSEEKWKSRFSSFGLHRYQWAYDRVWRIARVIVRDFDGDVRRISEGKSPPDVLATLIQHVRAVPEIGRMIVGGIIDTKHLIGEADVKADLHITRVLGRVYGHRLSPAEALELARRTHPDNPWKLDNPLYDIGKKWCKATPLQCHECPLKRVCDYCCGSSHYGI